MRNDTVENFLQSLAAKVPAPGGGATAALYAVQAAALAAVGATATTSRVNIEVNLGGISRTAARAEFRAAVNSVDRLTERADKLTATVRAELTR